MSGVMSGKLVGKLFGKPRIRRIASGGVRLRTTAAAVLTVAVALALASAGLLWALQSSLESSARAEAAAKAKAAAIAVKAGIPALPPLGSSEPSGSVAGSAPSGSVAGSAPSGSVRGSAPPDSLTKSGPSGSFTKSAPPGSLTTSAPPKPTVTSAPPGAGTAVGGGDVQVVSSGGPSWTTGSGYIVAKEQVDANGRTVVIQGRSSLAPTRAAISALRRLLVPGVPALLLLVGLLTWLAVGRALKPVSAIRGKLADITAHDLHERVPEPSSRDEIAALARTVNATLDRLQTAVEQHKRFVADAAHELRSPLAVLRTRLELTGPDVAAPLLAGRALTDVQRLQTLTADLLLLARLDAGEPLRDQEVDLGQVVAEEAAKPRPRPIPVDLDVAADVLVRGSADQLARLVANLVDNAVRHASSAVRVRLTTDGALAVLEVSDDGPGIPPEHRETVFDRFTRLDQARTRDQGGSGLGLAIARDIAVAHGGSLTVAHTPPPGACLRTALPVAEPPGPPTRPAAEPLQPSHSRPSARPVAESPGPPARPAAEPLQPSHSRPLARPAAESPGPPTCPAAEPLQPSHSRPPARPAAEPPQPSARPVAESPGPSARLAAEPLQPSHFRPPTRPAAEPSAGAVPALGGHTDAIRRESRG